MNEEQRADLARVLEIVQGINVEAVTNWPRV